MVYLLMPSLMVDIRWKIGCSWSVTLRPSGRFRPWQEVGVVGNVSPYFIAVWNPIPPNQGAH